MPNQILELGADIDGNKFKKFFEDNYVTYWIDLVPSVKCEIKLPWRNLETTWKEAVTMLLYNIWFFQRLAYSPYPFQHEEWSSKDLWLRVLSARAEIIGVINLMK